VERLGLIKPVSVLGSDDIGVDVGIRFPRGLVEELGVGLEAACFSASSISFCHGVIKFTICNWKFHIGIWFSSKVWFQICFSESGAPLLENCLVLIVFSSVSVTSELHWSSFVESLLIGLEINTLPLVAGLSKVSFFLQASSCDFCE